MSPEIVEQRKSFPLFLVTSKKVWSNHRSPLCNLNMHYLFVLETNKAFIVHPCCVGVHLCQKTFALNDRVQKVVYLLVIYLATLCPSSCICHQHTVLCLSFWLSLCIYIFGITGIFRQSANNLESMGWIIKHEAGPTTR